ncbi:hypothetical protein BGZ76_001040, partial [Entomortierella beljakovae]
MQTKKIFCLVDGYCSSTAFPIKATSTDTIADLKRFIKAEKGFGDIDPDNLILWKVSFTSTPKRPITLSNLNAKGKNTEPTELLDALKTISETFDPHLLGKMINVIVKPPLPINNTLLGGFSLSRSCTPTEP